MFSKSRKFSSLLKFSCLCVFLGIVNPICSDEIVMDVMITGAFPKYSPYKDLRMIGYDKDGNLKTTEFVMFECCDTGAVTIEDYYILGEKRTIVREPSRYQFRVDKLGISTVAGNFGYSSYYMVGLAYVWNGEIKDKNTNGVIEEAKEEYRNPFRFEITKDFYDYLEAGFGDEISYTEYIVDINDYTGEIHELYDGVRMDSIQRAKFLEDSYWWFF